MAVGASQGPSFEVRAGAPHEAVLEVALTLLSAKSPPKDAPKQQPTEATTAADGAVDEGESIPTTSKSVEGEALGPPSIYARRRQKHRKRCRATS